MARTRSASALLLFALPLALAGAACSSGADASPAGDETAAGEDDVIAAPSGATEGDAGASTTTDAATPRAALKVHSLANLGDSISQAFDADDSKPIDLGVLASNPGAIFHDNTELSWVQGTDPRIGSVRSHYLALDPGLVHNRFSISGTEMVRDLEKQARAIGTAGAHPDLVYVLIGGNDICNRQPSATADATENLYSVDQWREAVGGALEALVDVLDAKATVRFVSMPRVDLLYETLATTRVPVKFNTPAGPISGSSTCKDLWSITAQQGNGICKIVTTQRDAAKRKAIGDRIDAYNDTLAELVRRFDTDRTFNPKGISFQSDWHGSLGKGNTPNSSVGTYRFTPAEVSKLDCFHPSIAGQKAIADHVLTKANWEP